MRLILAIASLEGGGAERVLSIMANHWAARGWDITVLTVAGEEGDFYQLDERVQRRALNLASESPNVFGAVYNNSGRVRAMRKAVESIAADAVISFVDRTNVLALAATSRLDVPVIVSERIDIMKHPLGRPWRWLRHRLYPKAAAIVVQTETVKSKLPASWQRRSYVIPNPVGELDSGAAEMEVPPAPYVLAVGRLNRQKGFDILLDAFARMHAEQPQWHLLILGEGVERNRLETQVAKLGLDAHVSMPGMRKPKVFVEKADMFVLASRYEGFPNALLENMASGVACVSTNCPSGPADIIEDGHNGVLVEPDDARALADAMVALARDPEKRKRIGEAARAVKDRFSTESIMTQWEAVLTEVRRDA
jgi:glycosyltransferase involved in cell wall biosynthesis